MGNRPDDPVELVIWDATDRSVLHQVTASTATVAGEAISWARQYECTRLDRLEAALRDALGCGMPPSGYAILINRPNMVGFMARWIGPDHEQGRGSEPTA